MVPRFFAPSLRRDSTVFTLPPDEAAHLTRVLRLAPGAPVRVFDGRGLERAGTVARTTKSVAELVMGEELAPAPEPRARLTLGQALLKADKFDGVVRDAAMLGVAAVRPLLTTRAEVSALASRDGGRVERWRRVAVASVKQCGRAVVPDVEPVADLAACLAADSSVARLILAEPSLGRPARSLRELGTGPLAGAASVLVLAGPEGGWTDEEVDRAYSSGCHLVTLGRRILRADAAPVVALSVLLHVLEEG